MPTIGSYTDGELASLLDDVRETCGTASSLQLASTRCLERLWVEFGDSLVLGRVFATIPLGFLPDTEQTFARSIARQRGVSDQINEDTTIAALLASRGIESEWNDPRNSRKRLAIPLVNASFVKTVPLMSRLLGESNSELTWLDKQKTLISKQTVGNMAQLIYVEDAMKSKTGDGYMTVPEQEFVSRYGVRTVVAMGGRYLNGTFIGIILFTTELISLEQVSILTPIVNTFKSSTMKTVMGAKLY